ncbi:MAG TPA: SRPBCC family protein [Thermoleophilaceae bacterium]|jgi:uncharacterized protein YndB with AHSA1/START domain|nr:SRPBCC family protein [Thermoleophilaceae bacterium]
MAQATIHIDAPPEAVFETVADARSYAYWVLGSLQCARPTRRGPSAAAPSITP